jgi:hypothetical protein
MVNMATKIAEASQKGTRPIRPTTKTRPRAAAPARRRSLVPLGWLPVASLPLGLQRALAGPARTASQILSKKMTTP